MSRRSHILFTYKGVEFVFVKSCKYLLNQIQDQDEHGKIPNKAEIVRIERRRLRVKVQE